MARQMLRRPATIAALAGIALATLGATAFAAGYGNFGMLYQFTIPSNGGTQCTLNHQTLTTPPPGIGLQWAMELTQVNPDGGDAAAQFTMANMNCDQRPYQPMVTLSVGQSYSNYFQVATPGTEVRLEGETGMFQGAAQVYGQWRTN